MDKTIQKKTTRRLKIVEGQIRGLQKMIAEEKYCIDIISQTLAIKSALSGVEDLLLQNHLKSHVLHQIKTGKEDKAINEILAVYKLGKKK